MNGQALRIFANAPRRSSLVRPARSRPPLLVTDEDTTKRAAPTMASPMASPMAPPLAAPTMAPPPPPPAGSPELTDGTIDVTIERLPAAYFEPVEREVTRITRVLPCELEPFDPALERAILDILTSNPTYGETIEAAYRRKEHELADLFGSLSRFESNVLRRRLSEPAKEDKLAQRFARLVVERRMRLLGILADAPRREARGR